MSWLMASTRYVANSLAVNDLVLRALVRWMMQC